MLDADAIFDRWMDLEEHADHLANLAERTKFRADLTSSEFDLNTTLREFEEQLLAALGRVAAKFEHYLPSLSSVDQIGAELVDVAGVAIDRLEIAERLSEPCGFVAASVRTAKRHISNLQFRIAESVGGGSKGPFGG